jgi:ABC-type polysaccharide/polyol phosphate transport system ATPase subunit
MTSVRFDKVTVQYPVFSSRNKSLRSQLVRLSTGGRIEKEAGGVQVVTALSDVSFDLAEGDRVGLVGHNGAGKSTLLRTMAGIYAPATGAVRRRGRVATVLELGAGMDGELSGYENIRRMSMLLGRTGADCDQALPDIEAFTQLGHFLNLPVRTYSSGMTTRLMFAVATSTAPDILLLDEVFGTGDAQFQAQARERMEALIERVGIFVFASHEHDKLKRYCKRFFRLDHGSLREIGAGDF